MLGVMGFEASAASPAPQARAEGAAFRKFYTLPNQQKTGKKLLIMDRAVHPKGARAVLRAPLAGPLGPYVHLIYLFHRRRAQNCYRIFATYAQAATRTV